MKASDHFAEFRRLVENAGNAGNRVTDGENAAEINDFRRGGSVTHNQQGRVTSVTESSAPAGGVSTVTHVTQASGKWVTDSNRQKPDQTQGQSESVTRVTHVTRKNDDAGEICIAPDSRHPLIEPAVRAKLEAIETEARAKGWPAELLWNAAFWDMPRGLATLLDPEDEIVEVTHEYIAILKIKRDLLKFRRHVA